MTFALIEPDLGRVSGGLRFNAELCAASEGRIERIVAPGDWSQPSPADVRSLRELVEHRSPVLVDGLIGCSLAEPLSGAVVMLQHALARTASDQHRERTCLSAASTVITPSDFCAAEVARRYSITAAVARPGMRSRPVTCPGRSAHFISIGAIEDNKNQLFLAEVLRTLHDRGIDGWSCTFAGPVTDTGYARQVRERTEDLTAVNCLGELDTAGVDELYAHADLLLLPSKTETFGMVVREAAAAAIPAVVTAGTGAEEALAAGRALPLGVKVWTDFLERWLRDDAYRDELCTGALTARASSSHGWDETARAVLALLDRVA